MLKFVFTWIALMLLLALTAGSALLHLGAWNTWINFAAAAAKGLLVALIFMRLDSGAAILRITAATGLFTLALLFTLWAADYATRPAQTAPAYQQPSVVRPQLGSRYPIMREAMGRN